MTDCVDEAIKLADTAHALSSSEIMVPVNLLEQLITCADAYIGATEIIEPYVCRNFYKRENNKFLPAGVQDSLYFLINHYKRKTS